MKHVLLFVALLALTLSATAQKAEFAVLGGGHFPIEPTIDVNAGLAAQGNFAGRIANLPFVNLYVEVPVIATFGLNAGVDCAQSGATACKYNALFVTPGLKLKLAPEFPVSPYFVFGGGYGRFQTTLSGGGTDTRNVGVFNFGGGTDFNVLPFVALRAELRDMYAGRPRLSVAEALGRQHNLIASGGLVLRF